MLPKIRMRPLTKKFEVEAPLGIFEVDLIGNRHGIRIKMKHMWMVGAVEKQYFNLMQFFDGYVKNYRRLNLSVLHNRSMFTKREIDYFANLGELLGFDAFVEDYKFDKVKERSRPMDLSWWKSDARFDKENYLYLALHLERENVWNKDEETVEKLFSKTEEGYVPHNVIGIQFIESADRIDDLNKMVIQLNKVQKSASLMIYRFYDNEFELERVRAYHFTPRGLKESRTAICKLDQSGYWFMLFEEEYGPDFVNSQNSTRHH